jgi:hypothetical protein
MMFAALPIRVRLTGPSRVSATTVRSLYPWTEFVETDDGRLAAGISDPAHPRALLKHGAPIPDWFGGATVERTDQLFHGIRQGPSLRVVVASDEEFRMVRHGYWVAGLRNRL